MKIESKIRRKTLKCENLGKWSFALHKFMLLTKGVEKIIKRVLNGINCCTFSLNNVILFL